MTPSEKAREERIAAILREGDAMRKMRPMSPWRNKEFGDLVVTVGSLPTETWVDRSSPGAREHDRRQSEAWAAFEGDHDIAAGAA